MGYVIVEGLPIRLTTPLILKKLSWVIRGHYELVYVKHNFSANNKTCYLKLSPNLNPQSVVSTLNRAHFGHTYKITASFSQELPVQPPRNMKPKVLPDRLRQKMHIPLELSPKEVLLSVLNEMIIELQYKYTGLLDLSKKTNHKLLENLSSTIANRIKQVAGKMDILTSARKLSKLYRTAYPHFGDFQLILSTLHAIEDAQAQPRSQLNEKELTSFKDPKNVITELTSKKPHDTCRKYWNKINKKVVNHIKSLQIEPENSEEPREEEVARRKVREQLVNLIPFFPLVIKEVITKHFIPRTPLFYRVRMYGEPHVPSRQQLDPYFKELHGRGIGRSEKTFNLLSFKVPRAFYAKALQTDGKIIGDCKLIIRPQRMLKYSIPEYINEGLCALPASHPQPAPKEVEAEENWEEW